MRKPLSQLPLDFGGEEQQPSPPLDANGSADQREGQYLAAPGVGVRVKSFKKPAPPPEAVNAGLFSAPSATEPAAEIPTPIADPPTPIADLTPIAESPAHSTIEEPAEPPAIPLVFSAAEPPAIPTTEPPAIPTAEPALIETDSLPAPTPRLRREPIAANGKTTFKAGPSKRGRKSLKQATAEADLIEIPADEVLFSKQYYTMGEVSEMFKVNQSLLRYWETEFDILQPRKNKKGDRYFRPVDIKNLHLIYHLLRQKKYTIEGAKDFLKNNKKAKERFEVIERLQQIRNFLLEWKAQL